MKIAVCISGQPRCYAQGYEYLKKNLLDHYKDVDIYIHTWKNNVYSIEDVISLYQPVDHLEEDYPWSVKELNEKYTNTPDAINFPPANAVLSYYSVFHALSLKLFDERMHSKNYDWVIKTRFDYALNGQIPFETLDRNKLYVPNCRMVITRDFCNDQFAFGSNEVMDKYMSTYIYLDEFYSKGVQMNGEAMLSATLKHYGLVGEKLVYVDMNNPFPPGPYNGTTHALLREDRELWKNA